VTAGCPDLDALGARRDAPDVRAHLDGCASCRLVAEVLVERAEVAAARSAVGEIGDACARFEALIAAREAGALPAASVALLDAHLLRCEGCAMLAESLDPAGEEGEGEAEGGAAARGARGDHAELPVVEPSAYARGPEVARGGMGRVIAARDLRVGRPVAVKELLVRTPARAARFEREARVTARLQHPGIVPIYEIGRWPDGTPFYAMRMVDGRTLFDALAAADGLAGRLALLPAVIAATEAVAFAHAHRVIHRDLTPANVIVGAYGETVVIDWGLAKDLAEPAGADADPTERDIDAHAHAHAHAHARASAQLSRAGEVIGTAAYIPPEQALGDAVAERADVYALGAILYHLLAGAPPYTGRADEILRRLAAGPPPAIEAAASGAPRDLVSIVGKAMARDPARRYASARELADELVRFRAGLLVEAHAYSRRELWGRWLRQRRAAVIAASAALVAIAAAGAISLSRVVEERDRAERERTGAIHASARLLEEQGRQELLAGNPMRAAAWLAEAYAAGNDAPSLRRLLGLALRDVELVRRTLDCGGEVQGLALDPAATRLAAACDGAAKLWRISDGAELATLAAPGAQLGGIRFSHDGRALLTWGNDGAARLWRADTGALARTLVGHGARIFSAELTADDAEVVTTGFDGTARVWRAADGAELRAIEVSRKLRGVRGALAPGGVLVTMTSDGRGAAWELATGRAIGAIDHGAPIVGANLSADGALGVTCGADRTARIWDIRARRLVRELTGHAGAVLTCELAPGGDRLLTTSQDGTAKLWELATGRVVAAVAAGGIVADGQFSPDGRRFTTVNLDGTLRLWSADAGALIASVDDPGGSVLHAFAGDHTLFAARRDGTIHELDLRRTRLRHAFTAPAAATGGAGGDGTGAGSAGDGVVVGASVDGARIATRRGDAITVWDAASGRAIADRAAHLGSADPWASFDPSLGTSGPTAAAGIAIAVAPDAAAIRDAADGRLLAQLPIPGLLPALTQSSFTPLTGHAWLVPDGTAAVVLASGVAVWELPIETRDPAEVRALVRARVPWRVDDGRLVAAGGELEVRVTRRGAPARDAVVVARPLPDTIDGSVVMPPGERRYEARAGVTGTCRLVLPVGRYELEAAGVRRQVRARAATTAVELELP
jgi:WD40 repeat protein/tRNA A-37 threonylcarbamoyl transferase component Bud32